MQLWFVGIAITNHIESGLRHKQFAIVLSRLIVRLIGRRFCCSHSKQADQDLAMNLTLPLRSFPLLSGVVEFNVAGPMDFKPVEFM